MNHPEANGCEHEQSGEALSVTEALDCDLDAYLDRELAMEPEVDGDGDAALTPTREAAEDMRALLDLAEEETRWISESPRPAFSDAEPGESVSESAPVVIPEWMRANPEVPVAEAVRLPWGHSKVVPVKTARGGSSTQATPRKNTVSEVQGPLNLQQQPWGIPMVPPAQQWSGPMAPGQQHAWDGSMAPGQQHAWGGPVAAPTASSRGRDVVSGVLLGVAAVGVVAAGMLVVASVRFWEQGASSPSVNGVAGTSAHQGALGASARQGVAGSDGSVGSVGQLNRASNSGALVGANASGQLNSANSTGALVGANASGQLNGVGNAGALVDANTSGQLNGVGNAGALVGANVSGQLNSASASWQFGQTGSSVAMGYWAIPGLMAGTAFPGVADTNAMNPVAPRYMGPYVWAPPGSISDIANGLHAQGASTDPARALTSFSVPSGADLMARRDTLAVKSGERSIRTESAPTTRAPVSTTPTQSVAEASSGAVMEMTFEEPDSDEQTTSAPADTTDDPDGATSTESELDEEFARELGFTEDGEERAASESTVARTVYVPPALDAKEHLTPEDVKQVVVSNQPAITACLRQHAADTSVQKDGRFVVRWSVLPSGEATSVAMDTQALRATPLAGCIEGVVRGWKFPVHTVRMQEPIRFPFVF
ncbi:AgmX/PglI C-terminal domain-containing protein [Myxococcus sp. CA051A]|uniref:AgmX/PglI C-terminal domain-containing protein n=1 Tax=unclassified Myxococcus TaxID=2648731 RepID=UPI00157ADA57|nr:MULTISPECIES: AgmX/PglI C-terminal domain-containing protein [unclassified Myxococcus]NTX40056.1 AgmX/PglI C-terminal domain-containing protein [Myxococcus sp. CA033]NTX64452.1 AgmX/PglI C-terminal domain-containing protein [Myxococcus sp. CA051A]